MNRRNNIFFLHPDNLVFIPAAITHGACPFFFLTTCYMTGKKGNFNQKPPAVMFGYGNSHGQGNQKQGNDDMADLTCHRLHRAIPVQRNKRYAKKNLWNLQKIIQYFNLLRHLYRTVFVFFFLRLRYVL